MKHILIVQLCRLGDILQTTPMLRGLRRTHPGAHVTLMLHDMFRSVPVPPALFDRLVAFPYSKIAASLSDDARSWPRQVSRLREFTQSLGDEPYDLVLNLTHSDLAGLLTAVIPSRDVRGGLIAADRTRIVNGRAMTYFWASQKSRAQGCFNLVDLHTWAAELPLARDQLEIAIPEAAQHRISAQLASRVGGRPLVAVQLGASDDRKRWPPERFADAVNQLSPDTCDVVLVGTNAERPLGERLKARLTRPVVDLQGDTSIVEVAALFKRCRILLTNDTGTMHIAAGVGARVMDVSTGPVYAHETGPYGEGHLVIQPEMSCFPCAAGSTCHHLDCRDAFAPADVAGLVQYMLGSGTLPTPGGARILTGTFTRTGRLEYRSLWPAPNGREILRLAAAEVWESTLFSSGALATREDSALDPSPDSRLHDDQANLEEIERALDHVAGLAQNTAGMARRVPHVRRARQAELASEVSRGLEAMRLVGELVPVCQPIVAYLTVCVESTADRDIERLARVYERECLDAANRAQRLRRALMVRYPPGAESINGITALRRVS